MCVKFRTRPLFMNSLNWIGERKKCVCVHVKFNNKSQLSYEAPDI